MFAYHFMVNAFRAGTAVAVVTAVVGWFMVLREADVRGSQPLGRRIPGRGRRSVAGAERQRRILRILRGGRARDRGRSPHDRTGIQRAVRGHRHGPSLRARVRAALREPVRGLSQRGDRVAVRELSRHHRCAGRHARGRDRGVPRGARGRVPAVALRLGRSRRRGGSGDPRPRSFGAVPRRARCRGRGSCADHRRAARVRPARRTGRSGAGR